LSCSGTAELEECKAFVRCGCHFRKRVILSEESEAGEAHGGRLSAFGDYAKQKTVHEEKIISNHDKRALLRMDGVSCVLEEGFLAKAMVEARS
jgi:hypothetical protein